MRDETDAESGAVFAEPITEAAAAARLGLKVATLRAWRHRQRGPAFLRLGRAIRYLPSDLDAFVAASRHSAILDHSGLTTLSSVSSNKARR